MAYFKITQNKKGELQAKIQVSGKDLSTGKSKVFTKRVYNTDELTEAKFRKQVERLPSPLKRRFRAPIRTAKRSSAQRC